MPEAGWSNYSVNFNNPILISDPLGDKGKDMDKVNKKTGLSGNDIKRIQNSMANEGDMLSRRQINRMAKDLIRNGGDWKKVELKTKTDFNLAFTLAVNLLINKSRITALDEKTGHIQRICDPKGLNMDQIIANQQILKDRAKDAGFGEPAGRGLRIENATQRILKRPEGATVPLSGTNATFRRVYADEIQQTLESVGDKNGRHLLVGTKVDITTDSPGTVTINTFEASLTGEGDKNVVAHPFEFSEPNTKEISQPPSSMLPKKEGNTEGYDVRHSNPNATTTIQYHFYIFNDIYVH